MRHFLLVAAVLGLFVSVAACVQTAPIESGDESSSADSCSDDDDDDTCAPKKKPAAKDAGSNSETPNDAGSGDILVK